MKKLVVVVVLLVLLLGVAPWGVGRIAEGRMNKHLDKMLAEAPYITVVERKWTGGWFRSEQEVTFELFGEWLKGFGDAIKQTTAVDGPATDGVALMNVADEAPQGPMPEASADGAAAPDESAPDESAPEESSGEPLFPASLRFTVKNEILHGPVLWTSGIGLAEVRSKPVLSEELRKKIVEMFGTDEPVRFKTRVGLFGGGTSTISGDAATIKPKGANQAVVSWEAFKLSVGYSDDLDHFDVKGKQPRIEGKGGSDGAHVVMRDIAVDLDSERIVGDLYDTDFKMTIAEVSGAGADKKQFTATGIHYILATEKKGEFVDMALKLGAGEFKTAEFDQLGIQLKEVHYDLSLRRLHVATLAKVLDAMKAAYANPLPATTTPSEIESALFQPMKNEAIALFKHDPEVGLDRIGIVTAEGEGFLKGVIKFKGVTAADFENPMLIIPKLDAEFSVEVPQKMIEKFPNGATMAGAAVDSGYAKRDGDKLVCKITFKAGQLLVNGKPQAVPGLGGPPPGQGMEEMPPEEMPAPKE